MLPRNNVQVPVLDKEDVSRLCKCILSKSRRDHSPKLNQKLRFIRRNLVVALLAWLFMNTDPAYPQRVLGSMLASRIIHNSLTRPTSLSSLMGGRYNDNGNHFNHHHGMNTAEAIALIHAMNNTRGNNPVDLSPLLRNEVASSHARTRESPMRNYLDRQRTNALDRQQPTSLNRQANPLNPLQVLMALVTALATFLMAAATGANPVTAALAALAAALAALLAALAAVVVVPTPPVGFPLVKKLIIKKTVLPFVIPIPYKKKEKEIVYIPKPVHYHHKEHHHVEHKYKKHKKSDFLEDDITSPPPTRVLDSHNLDHGDKIQTLLSEQDRIQSIIDQIAETKSAYGAASTTSTATASRPKPNDA